MIVELCRFAADPTLQQVTSKKGTKDESVLLKVTVPVTYRANGKYHIINIEAWEKQAEYIVKTFKKGEWAHVTGSLIRKEWQDANGYNRHDFYIAVQSVSTLPTSKPTTENGFDSAVNSYFEHELDEIPPILQD